tara:strand:+ start:489 stop:869 length:381 start_codon:yes stop_codon:yes gene_type:complete
MKTKLNSVNEMHKVFKIGDAPKEPTLIPKKEYILRYDLMKEETDEYLEACLNNDIVEIADALGDELYILCGTILKHGMQYKIEQVFNEIHRSNMSKLDLNGQPIFREDGKILKGQNYFKPDLTKIL